MSEDFVSITVDLPRFQIRKGTVYRPRVDGLGVHEKSGWVVRDECFGSVAVFSEHSTALEWVRLQLRWGALLS